ncbi:MAG TPA: hypothetical protein VE569_09235 [Acidimicrobiia bacterium]|nr:hypothetical protein [Acidimicrobiia bacterium]
MRVRCGACRTQFDVPGAGRFACPVCGSVNVVRNGAGDQNSSNHQHPSAQGQMGGYPTAPGVTPPGAAPQPPPPLRPEEPMPKIECPECGFNFIIGKVATVTCPMCSAEVSTGIEEENGD